MHLKCCVPAAFPLSHIVSQTHKQLSATVIITYIQRMVRLNMSWVGGQARTSGHTYAKTQKKCLQTVTLR